MLKFLREVINEDTTHKGRIFDIIVQILIIISLITFSIETLPDLSAHTYETLRTIEVGIVAFFTLEYVLRVLVAEKKSRYIFSFYGIIDLLAILPFYLSGLMNLQALRFLRLLRLLKFTRYNSAIVRVGKAIWLSKEELILFGVFTLMLLYLAALGIYHFEHEAQPEKFRSIFDCLWWAVATLTTVGYGDIYPITLGGRLFTFVILMVGLGVVAVPTGIVASALSSVRKKESEAVENTEDSPVRQDRE